MDLLNMCNMGVRTQDQGTYEVFGALRVTDMFIEIYLRTNIRVHYQKVRNYLNIYHNKRQVSKLIRTHSNEYFKER